MSGVSRASRRKTPTSRTLALSRSRLFAGEAERERGMSAGRSVGRSCSPGSIRNSSRSPSLYRATRPLSPSPPLSNKSEDDDQDLSLMDIMKKVRDGNCRAGQKGLRQRQRSPERSAEQKVGPVVMKRGGRKGSSFMAAKSSPLSDSLSVFEAGKRKGETETETETNADIAGHTSLYDMMQKLSASKPKPHVQESAEDLMDGHKSLRMQRAQWHQGTVCDPPPSPHLDEEADRRSHSCVPHLNSIPASSGSSDDERISLEQLMRDAAQKRKDREREKRSPGEAIPFPAGDMSTSSSKTRPPRGGQEKPEADDQEDGEGDVSLADMLVQVSQKKKGHRENDPQRSIDSAGVRELADAKDESDSKAAVKQVDAKK